MTMYRCAIIRTSSEKSVSRFIFLLALSILSLALSAVTRAESIDSEEGRLVSLYSYKPIYVLAGNPYSKLQFSFQTQLHKSLPLYVAYTQLMMWDLFISSPYFYDLDYNPLVWYRLRLATKNKQWLDLIPWEHESNGKGGDLERAWDRLGAGYHITAPLNEKTNFYLDFKAWIPMRYNKNNSDLAQYRGLWELTVAVSRQASPHFPMSDLTFRLYPGGPSLNDPTHGGQELTFRIRGDGGQWLPYAIAQVFHGYGQYLQDYAVDQWDFRIGVGF